MASMRARKFGAAVLATCASLRNILYVSEACNTEVHQHLTCLYWYSASSRELVKLQYGIQVRC